MKKVFVLAMLPLLFLGCVKSNLGSQACTDVSPASEEAQIIAYCNANVITYTKDSSGIFYQIINSGTDPKPTSSSKVSFIFTAKFLNNALLSEITTPYTEQMVNLIEGWKIGLRLIGKGGRIKLVIPSSFAYGCDGAPPSINPNSIIYYDITLIDVL